MQLRYSFRRDPSAAQISELTRLSGFARVVYNDALALRRKTFQRGLPQISSADLQRQVLTLAKRSPERAFLADVGVDPLIQAVRDLESAYGNFFASLAGSRKGRRMAEPRFKSRKDRTRSVRFTRHGFKLRKNERLYLAKIGEVRVRWSRELPSDPSSVTVVRDAAGRYHASFVIESDPRSDAMRFIDEPELADAATSIDLGLNHFAVLSKARRSRHRGFCVGRNAASRKPRGHRPVNRPGRIIAPRPRRKSRGSTRE